MALTAPLDNPVKKPRNMRSFPIKTAVELFIGSYVGIELASGALVKVSDAAGIVPVGRVVEFDPPLQTDGSATGDLTAAEPVEAIIAADGWIEEDVTVVGASAITDRFDGVHATDDNTFTLTPGASLPPVGRVDRHISGTTCNVEFFSAAEMSVDIAP